MKNCPHCGVELNEGAMFCQNCGQSVLTAPAGAPAQQPPVQQPVQPPMYTPPVVQPPMYTPTPVPTYDPYDHTAEFEAQDISDNKVYCMLLYLLGVMGIIIALLASHDSAYVKFHLRQALKFVVVETLIAIISFVLCWTIVVPIVGLIALIVLLVVKIICFFQICGGKAKEPAIIKSLSFLK